MRRLSKVILTGLLAGGLAGCNSFLSSDEAAKDPNNPSQASIGQLYTAIQTATFAQQEGIVAVIGCMWTQQCTGTSNFLQTLERYNITSEDTPSPAFSAVYEAGGLVDIRSVERLADSVGDKKWKGIAEIYEAITMTMAADVWGDVPYRQAVNAAQNPKPTLDPQLQVYGDILTLLDQAIADLGGAGAGPGSADLVFGGDAAKWTAVAHTLKARIHLHLVEKNGNAEYQNAITEATLGINDASGAGDFRSFHGSNPQEDNLWYQFNTRSGFGQFIVAGRFLADVMVTRTDPRLPEYFGADAKGRFGGQDPRGNPTCAESKSPCPDSSVVVSLLEGTRNAPNFKQPLITFDENQLILAEANFVLNGAGAAQPFVTAVRTKAGLGAKTVATLNDVMEEKYIALYQNYEVWNDYKRTCYPQITPYPNSTFGNVVPGRLFYGTTETSANPNNIPDRNVQLQVGGSFVSGGITGFRNPNDPNPCP